MGCCSSSVVKSPSTKMVVEIATTTKSDTQGNEIASPEKIKIEIIIPRPKSPSDEDLLTTAENSEDSEDSGKSVSPTGVAQRSRRKSVTFNPISTVKEYRRDSSSTDKDYITYFCEQLGFDTLSDTDSTDGIDDDCDHEIEDEEMAGTDHESSTSLSYDYTSSPRTSRSPNYSPTFQNATNSFNDQAGMDEDEEWLRYEMELLRESEIDPSDPRYVQDYDIEYDPDYFHHHRGSGSGSFKEHRAIWACS